MQTVRSALVALLLLFVPAAAKALDLSLGEAAGRIGQLLAAGKLADAQAVATQSATALAADPSLLPATDVVALASAISDVAYRLASAKKYGDAEILVEHVVALREQALGGEAAAVAQALNDEGILLTTLGRDADAAAVLARALAIREKLPNGDADVAQTLNNLAQARKRLGQTADVEGLLRRTAILQEAALGPESAALADTLADIADILQANGRATEAEPLATRALAITEKVLGPNDPELARRLIKLANVTSALNRLSDAEALFRRALAIREKAFGAESQQTAGVLSNLANVIIADNRPAEAEPLLRQALELQIKLRGANHPSVGATQARLANSLRDQARFDEADAVYAEAITTLVKAFGRDHPQVAEALEDYGHLRFEQKRFGEALDLFRRAGEIIARREEVGDPVRPGSGILTRTQGEAFRWIAETGFEIADRDESQRQALATEAYLAIQLFTRSRTGVSLDQATVRIGRSRPELRDIVRERESLTKLWQKAEAALIEALGAAAGGSASTGGALTGEMARVEARIKEIDATIARDFADFSELLKPKALTVSETQELLGPDEAAITFSVDDTDTLIWVITKQRTVWVHSPLREKELTALVEKLRAGVDGTTADFDLAAAHTLYKALLGADRVEAAITGKKHLIVIPNGALTSLPFQLLVTEPSTSTGADRYRDAAWLIRRYGLSVLPSVSSLRLLRRAAAADEAPLPFIGFGDPVFKRPGTAPAGAGEDRSISQPVNSFYRERVPDLAALSRGLAELPETADEMRKVSATLGANPNTVIIRERASETTLRALNAKGALANYRVVYFATHGLVAGEVEQLLSFRAEPALALSLPKVATQADDGLLTATDAAELKLNADWVVLSACNTAAGDKPGAEALSGLARSFFYAGARSLLVSHWSVISEAAVTLTTGTFARLASNPSMSKAEALRETMIDIIDRGADIADAHPRYWAPFSIVGFGGSL
ncbi:MAG: CHAT domain-containing tetratricopeptide repeat protein [Bauldia sp.]